MRHFATPHLIEFRESLVGTGMLMGEVAHAVERYDGMVIAIQEMIRDGALQEEIARAEQESKSWFRQKIASLKGKMRAL